MIVYSNIIGKGTPLLILHGFLGMGDNWKTLGRQFSAEGFQVHLIDQRNHGRSFHSKSFNYDELANDLLDYINHHKLGKVVLLGHSMGGKTAMNFATLHPGKMDKLIVADISPRYYPVHHEAILNGLSQLDFQKITSRNQADEVLAGYVHEPGVRQFLLKNLYWVEKGRLGLRINLDVLKSEVAEVGEALGTFAKYDGPTLFLKGGNSEYIQAADLELIKRHFPKAKIVNIPGTGHWLHAEQPRQFFNEVKSFILEG